GIRLVNRTQSSQSPLIPTRQGEPRLRGLCRESRGHALKPVFVAPGSPPSRGRAVDQMQSQSIEFYAAGCSEAACLINGGIGEIGGMATLRPACCNASTKPLYGASRRYWSARTATVRRLP